MSADEIQAIKASIHALEIRIVKLETLVKIVVVLWSLVQFGFQVYMAVKK